jgi:hypothetical protein
MSVRNENAESRSLGEIGPGAASGGRSSTLAVVAVVRALVITSGHGGHLAP